jgi:hypothetical protein
MLSEHVSLGRKLPRQRTRPAMRPCYTATKHRPMRYLPLFLFSAWLMPTLAQTTYGTEHWVTFMENLNLQFNGPPSFHLVISSEVGSAGTVSIPATGFSVPFSVEAGTDEMVTLPNNIYYGLGDEALFNFGIRVNSEQPVRVYAYHERAYFSGSTLVLPLSALGTDHLLLARPDDSSVSPSQMVVMATQDNTVVEITPSVLTVSFRPPNVPFNVTLNAGQSFQLQAFDDLSGTRVRTEDATRPLAVFAGARQAIVNCDQGGADDHVYEQVYPLSLWGRDFFVVPFKDRGGDEVRILAGTVPTQVTVAQNTYSLAPGGVLALSVTTPQRIVSNAPIAVGQFNDSQSCNNGEYGDPNYIFLPATPLRDERFLWNAREGFSTSEHFVNIVVQQNGGVTGMLLDGSDISAQFQPIMGQSNWYYAQVSIPSGSHELVSDKPFQAVSYGMGFYDSYGLALGFDNETGIGVGELDRPYDRNVTVIAQGTAWAPGWVMDGREVLRVLDMGGRLVQRVDLQPGGTVDLSALEAGPYLVERWSGTQRTGLVRVTIQ